MSDVVESVEEIDALPRGTILLTAGENPAVKSYCDGLWWLPLHDRPMPPQFMVGCRVLFRPSAAEVKPMTDEPGSQRRKDMSDTREDRIDAAVDALNGILPAFACHTDLAGRECVRFTDRISVEIREMAARVVDQLATLEDANDPA